MTNINLERRAEIGREKRARTKAQLIAAAKALYSTRPWESVTVDEVVNEAGVAKGTFYTHFNDLNELAAAVADELVKSFDELIQPFRLSLSGSASSDCVRLRRLLSKSRSMTACGRRSQPGWRGRTRRWEKSRGSGSLKTCARRSSNLRRRDCRWSLLSKCRLESSVQVMAAIGEGRLKDGDRTEAVRCILTAIGVGGRDAASICARLSDIRRAHSARRP